MIKIRLARHGIIKKPFYKIVIARSQSPRDGKFIEKIGFFNPFSKNMDTKISINMERMQYWVKQGAKCSERVKNLLKTINKYNSIK